MVLESFRLENENEIIVRPRDIWHEYLALLVAPTKFVTLELRMRAGKLVLVLVLVLVLQSKALYYLFSKQLLLVLDANSWTLS